MFVQSFTPDEESALKAASTYGDVKDVALQQMRRLVREMGCPLEMVCGPISPSGGLGCLDLNLNRFQTAIDVLRAIGRPVFSQLPYETTLWRIRDLSNAPSSESHRAIMEQFYKPIFLSGCVGVKYFIPLWDSSNGSVIEHESGIRTGMMIFYLNDDLLPDQVLCY